MLITTYDPSWLSIFDQVTRDELAAGHRVIALDATALLTAPVDSYDRAVLRGLRIEHPGHDLPERMRELGAEYRHIDVADTDTSLLGDDLESELDIAVQSALITFYRTDRPDLSRRRIARVADGLRREGRAIYRLIGRLHAEEPDLAIGYVANGRFPNQKLATLAYRNAGLITKHLEKGEGPKRAYVQDYAPQDRLGSQGSVDSVLARLADAEVEQIADSWLAKRAPAHDSRNEFSALWSDQIPSRIGVWRTEGEKIVGFFTSSQDEFQFLGPEWHLHDWADQFQAFDAMLTRFEADGYRAFLRVHPNLATKEHGCFSREREGIRRLAELHPELVVIWHDDDANTYELLGACDAVVVWDSTVGLEASARGIPVWATATTRYGLIADVREVLSADSLAVAGTAPWPVDPRGSKRFIAYLVERDEDITTAPADWMSWNAGSPPLGVRLAAVTVSGAIPSRVEAVRSLVDVYRHRGRQANLRAIRRR
ncbi:hypothetical protein ASE14_05320 [Agromyces sp. Root81]|nr:hypothetical protein ASE14_05320 [Agromyces sp. Root81]